MVLETPAMPNLFNRSEAIGEGLGRRGMQKILDDMGLGFNMLTLIHAGHGSTTSLAETELDSHTFNKDDLIAEDGLIVVIEADGDALDVLKIRAADSVGSATSADILGSFSKHFYQHFSQRKSDNTIILSKGWQVQAGSLAVLNESFDLTDENVITTAWTLSLRGNTDGTRTLYFKWWIYRRGIGFEGET